MSDGISPILSNNYGAGNREWIQKTLRAALISNFLLGLALFSRILGMDGVWLSLPFAEAVTVGVCFWIGMAKRKQSGFAYSGLEYAGRSRR